MSSKAVSQHQQGRRTPLSLTGKHVQPQHQNNKNNTNSTKNAETRSDTNANKNGNNNTAKSTETTNQTQKELKKTQQNVSNGEELVKKSMGNGEDVTMEQNGKSNGHNKKNNSETTKPEQTNKEKETENVKEKSKKNETNKQTTAEKKQNEVVIEKPTAQVAPTPTNATKSKDGTSTPTSSAATTTVKENKKQTSVSAKTDVITIVDDEKNTTIEKGTATPTSKSQSNKKATPSKSPKEQTKNKPAEIIEIPDEEMVTLVVEDSPAKQKTKNSILPTATSTPGKVSGGKHASQAKTEIILNQDHGSGSSLERKSVPRSFSQISGRRSIRPIDDFTPSMYNSQFRESYRRINTELDVTSNTNNTSMNVTVGSEIPNNSSFLSFSLFGRGRKRERTPPLQNVAKSQSAVELSTETTPPKRARLDVHGIFTAMSSPLTLLRSRFSKTTLESSTPTKIKNLITANNADDNDVQNVSGVSIDEEVANSSTSNCNTDLTATGDNITVDKESIEKNTSPKSTPNKENVEKSVENGVEETDKSKANDDMDVDSDTKSTETCIIAAVGEPKHKQRGCTVM